MKIGIPFLNLNPEMVEKFLNQASGGEKQRIEAYLESMALAIHDGDFATASEIANEEDVYRVPLVGKFIEVCIYGKTES